MLLVLYHKLINIVPVQNDNKSHQSYEQFIYCFFRDIFIDATAYNAAGNPTGNHEQSDWRRKRRNTIGNHADKQIGKLRKENNC